MGGSFSGTIHIGNILINVFLHQYLITNHYFIQRVA